MNQEPGTDEHADGPILITGGGGFIGSHVVRQLARSSGFPLRVLELPGVDLSHLPKENIRIYRGSICDYETVREAARGCATVLHLAANPNLWARDPDTFEQVNHQGTRNVLRAAAACDVARTVYVSTESILTRKENTGSPQIIDETTIPQLSDQPGEYCRSKCLAEQAAREAIEQGEPVIIVRPTVPVGRGDHHRGPFTRMLADYAAGSFGSFYLPGRVNLIDVRDAASGIVAAATIGEIGKTYLLAGDNWQIADLFEYLSKITGRPAPRFRVPFFAAWTFAWLEERYYRHLKSAGQPSATLAGVQLARRSFEFHAENSLSMLHITARRTTNSIDEALEDLGVQLTDGYAEADYEQPEPQPSTVSAQRRAAS